MCAARRRPQASDVIEWRLLPGDGVLPFFSELGDFPKQNSIVTGDFCCLTDSSKSVSITLRSASEWLMDSNCLCSRSVVPFEDSCCLARVDTFLWSSSFNLFASTSKSSSYNYHLARFTTEIGNFVRQGRYTSTCRVDMQVYHNFQLSILSYFKQDVIKCSKLFSTFY